MRGGVDDIPSLDAAGNTPEYSVSEIAGALKRTVENAFGNVRVRGELTGFKRHVSGHWYGAMKDERAVIDLVMFKGAAAALTFRPEDGLEVIVTGKLTTFPGRSRYQIVVERMEPAGVGALLAQIEARRLMLAAEGLFDAGRKRPLPFIPRVIGVVTSPTGAVIRDILHRLADRFPRPVLVWPVAVQGEAAAAQVAAAVRGFNAIPPRGPIPRPDLIIVARGGGSIEDLAAFNAESVVRAVAQSRIPVISAGTNSACSRWLWVNSRKALVSAPVQTLISRLTVHGGLTASVTLHSTSCQRTACLSVGWSVIIVDAPFAPLLMVATDKFTATRCELSIVPCPTAESNGASRAGLLPPRVGSPSVARGH